MTIPLIVLAVLSAAGGVLLLNSWIVDWLEPVVGAAVEGAEGPQPWVITTAVLVVVAAGVAVAWLLFGRKRVPATAPAGSPVTRAARAELYGDAINEGVFVRPGRYLSRSLVFFDNRGVDGAVNGVAALVGGTSGRVRRFQTGFVRSYALAMLGGALLLVLSMLAVNLT